MGKTFRELRVSAETHARVAPREVRRDDGLGLSWAPVTRRDTRIYLGPLERAGQEGEELAIVLHDMLVEHLGELEVLYNADAELEVMNLLGVASYGELIGILVEAPGTNHDPAAVKQRSEGPSPLEEAAAALLAGR